MQVTNHHSEVKIAAPLGHELCSNIVNISKSKSSLVLNYNIQIFNLLTLSEALQCSYNHQVPRSKFAPHLGLSYLCRQTFRKVHFNLVV
jgi:hypothetical protein